MARITFKGNPIHTAGELPQKGDAVKDFTLVRQDLSEARLADFGGKKLLNIFPSLDTPVCATSVRKFNEQAASRPGVTVLNISADLPFAHHRFCAAEGIENAVTLSTFRSTFARDLGVEISDGPLRGLCSRAVLVLDKNNRVLYREQVPEIADEPNYEAALSAL